MGFTAFQALFSNVRRHVSKGLSRDPVKSSQVKNLTCPRRFVDTFIFRFRSFSYTL